MLGNPEALSHSPSGTLILSLRKLLKGLKYSPGPGAAIITQAVGGISIQPGASIRVAATLAWAWPPWALSPKSNHGKYMLASRGL